MNSDYFYTSRADLEQSLARITEVLGRGSAELEQELRKAEAEIQAAISYHSWHDSCNKTFYGNNK